jgi:hypothetical protein
MGNTLNYVMSSNNDWFVYKRLKNNKYSKEPEQTWRNISKETAINRFKHEIMAYVLNKYEYTDTKAIYLYINNTRVIRVENINNQVVIESKKLLQEFIEATEELPPSRYPMVSDKFHEKYCKNYARLDVYKIAYILNDPPVNKSIPSYENSVVEED